MIARKALKAAKLKIGANRKKQKGWRWEKPETFSIAFSELHPCSKVLAKSNSLSNSLITESNFSSNAWYRALMRFCKLSIMFSVYQANANLESVLSTLKKK